MKFSLDVFKKFVRVLAPPILSLIPGASGVAPLINLIIDAIGKAEASGLSGADKKAAVLAAVPAEHRKDVAPALDAIIASVNATARTHEA